MNPLKAFLCFRDGTGAWTTTAFRDLEALLQAWHEVLVAGASGAAMHVGFWRPDTAAMAALAEQHAGLLLLSEAAIHALPGSIAVSEGVVGQIDGLAFRLALRGFGYEVADDAASNTGTVVEGASVPSDARGWVGDLSSIAPDLPAAAASVGIWDDESYAEREGALVHDVRQKLGVARFILLTGSQPSQENILENIRACPPWFRSSRLHHLQLTARQANVFRAHGLATVDDVGKLGTSGLLKLNNMGRKSVSELAVTLYRSMLDGPVQTVFDRKEDDANPPPVTTTDDLVVAAFESTAQRMPGIRDAIVDSVQCLKNNERSVLAARMGFGCARLTLQEISNSVGVTRERVRQIEVKICKVLRTQTRWVEIEQRIDGLLRGRTMPLLLDGLSAIDPWFEGLTDLRGPMEFIFDRLLDRRLNILDVDGTLCVSRLSEDEWGSEVRAARRMLEGCVPDHISEDEARHLVESLLVGPGEELRGDLWSGASQAARFADLPDGTRRLMAYGKSAEAVVHAILSGSPVPLHYSEIQKRAVAEVDSPPDVRRIHNAAANVGILFARGTYGLPQHSPLNPTELDVVRAEVEDLMYGEASDRQWHCMELCDALVERGLGFDERLSKYVVNLALKGSPQLAYLGRLVWGHAASWQESVSSRIDVRQAVIALLEREGRPLSTAEIRSRLEMERGVNVHFQIHPTEPLVRVGPGEWGLMHRDLDLDVETARDLLAKLQDRLRVLGRGIHLSEVGRELSEGEGEVNARELNPYWISTLAKQSGLRTDKGQYVYLQEWGSSRRMSVQDSVQAALDACGAAGASIDDVWVMAGELSLRQCSKLTISQALQTVGAVFDPVAGLWRSNAVDAQASAEEDLLV